MRVGRDVSAISLFIALPLIGIIATRAAPAVALFSALCVALAHLVTRGRHWERSLSALSLWTQLNTKRWFGSAVLPAVLLYIWCWVSTIWSLDPVSGIKPLVLIAVCVPFAWVMSVEYRHLKIANLDIIMICGILGFGVYFIIENLLDLQLYRTLRGIPAKPRNFTTGPAFHDLGRSLVICSLVSWAVWNSPFLKRWRNVRVFIIAFFAVVLTFSVNQSIQLGFVAAALAGLIVAAWPVSQRVIFFGMIAALMAFPFIVSHLRILEPILALPELGHGQQMVRVEIWEQFQRFILGKPVLGWGVGSDSYLGTSTPNSDLAYLYAIKRVTIHSHSFIVQVWTELGAIGAVLLAWLLFQLGEIILRWNDAARVAGVQFVVSVFTYSAFSHSFTQSWWLAVLTITAIPFLMLRDVEEETLVA